jgi:antitoxin (DNA-binding transcriptional repressor) of toxin-antitoxin stability system
MAGKPLVRLVRVAAQDRRGVFGAFEVRRRIADDFDAPLPDDLARALGQTR